MNLSFSETIRAAREDAAVSLRKIDAVLVQGEHAQSYLQGQCSQELEALPVGASTEALLLSPQGKIDAFVRVIALGEDEFLVTSDGGQGSIVFDRLRRFKIRIKATLEEQAWQQVWCLGPNAPAVATEILAASSGYIFDLNWPGQVGFGVVAREIVLSCSPDIADERAIETLRIKAGIPVMGRDLDESTIAEEAGLVERTVSFSKGCYTGQELVARLDARGSNVARRLRLIAIPAAFNAEEGDELVGIDRVVGRLTSVSSAESGGQIALGYVARSVAVPGTVALRHGDKTDATVDVLALPHT